MTGSHPVSIWSLRRCIGLTEAQAREKYGDGLKIGRFNMAANGKSLIAGGHGRPVQGDRGGGHRRNPGRSPLWSARHRHDR